MLFRKARASFNLDNSQLNTGLAQLTSARRTLLNLAWLLQGYTSWQAAHLWLAKRPSPRRSPLAALPCGICVVRGSLWPELLTKSVKAAGITWGTAGRKVNLSRSGEGVWGGGRWWPMKKMSFLSQSGWNSSLPPLKSITFVQIKIHVSCFKYTLLAPLLSTAIRWISGCSYAHIWFVKIAAVKSRCKFIP